MTMITEEHVRTSREFLIDSDREFDAGDHLQASEKLWGAACHSVMALAQRRGWQFGDHRALKVAVTLLANEYQDAALQSGFGVAEKFHANFYHDFMQDFEIDVDRHQVHDFTHRVLGLV